MIEIEDVKKVHAAWTEKTQWETGFNPGMINPTGFELIRLDLSTYIRAGLNKNLEFQAETYWLGDGRLEGVAVIEPEKEIPFSREESKETLHPINYMIRFGTCPICNEKMKTPNWDHLKTHKEYEK